ncbi:MAG TPA: hypothetical protein VKZ63_19100 [Kofleriaceae bacterium]|nr:hypothetical protein [Kofleriaceae bacterium]
MRFLARVRAVLAGADRPGRSALPAGELLEPTALAAVVVLLVNDWILKRWDAVPALVSGKLSDVAGLLCAPLIATAALDLALCGAARLGAPVDFSLRRGKLVAATLAVGGAFAAVKLSPAAAGWLERAAAAAGLDWRIAADPTDLVALPALAAAVWLGRREIARVPLGRLAVVERRWRAARVAPSGQLADVVACGGDPELVAALAAALERYLDGGPAAPAEEALARLRA